jgi:hypothetical protein
MTMLQKPTVLILGSTGQIGRFILEYLKREPDAVHIRVTARRPEQVATFQQQGQEPFFWISTIRLLLLPRFVGWTVSSCLPATQWRCWPKARPSLMPPEKPASNTSCTLECSAIGLDRIAGHRRGCGHGSARRPSETQWTKLLAQCGGSRWGGTRNALLRGSGTTYSV